jgi:hypothetical protein
LAYDFLGLVNDVNDKFNEVRLTNLNFATATGYYADAKNAVNQALYRINFDEFEWPFNHVKVTLPTVVDQVEYNYPTDAKSVAFDTFRLKGNTALNVRTQKLFTIDYEDYLEKYGDAEFNPTNYSNPPELVYRGRNLKFGFHPPPDAVYDVVYEYYKLPPDLDLYTDVPTVPSQFKHVVYEGALYHAYMFRGDTESAAISEKIFKDLVKDMRKIYINRYEYVRSSVVRS